MFHFCSSTPRWLRAIVCVIIAVIFFVSYPSAALAQQKSIWQVASEQIQTLFGRRTKAKAPVVGRVRGGSGRGRCPEFKPLDKDEIPLTAFVPVIPEKQTLVSGADNVSPSTLNYVWGQTVEEHPTLWFYIPYTYNPSEIKQGKFVLLNKDKHIVAGPIFVNIPEQPSIAKFTLPNFAQGLELNQEYNWYFSIICNQLKPSRNPGVTGWIERVELQILPPENYQYYANKGLWYDAVNKFILSQNTQTFSQQAEWVDLIKFSLINVMEKPDNEKLNSLANQLAKFPIRELLISDQTK